MGILNLKTNNLNQNNYSINKNTPDFVGSLVIYPVDIIPEKCLPCDGYILKINDYKLLHDVIGSKYNDGSEKTDEFRIPDYNITKRFLQPSQKSGTKIDAGLPDINHRHFNGISDDASQVYGKITSDMPGTSSHGNSNGGAHTWQGYTSYIKDLKTSNIYGKSKTVQPASETVHVCIRYK